jgi:CBS domain-containing protein
MVTTMKTCNGTCMKLDAATAADLMRENPISISENATVQDAINLLSAHCFSAAPVIDSAGRATGVISRTDLLAHDREKNEYLVPGESYERECENLAEHNEGHKKWFQVVNVDRTRVCEIMTPTIFSVTPKTPVPKVVRDMLTLAVHRLFVVDDSGIVVGVITATDILRRLR